MGKRGRKSRKTKPKSKKHFYWAKITRKGKQLVSLGATPATSKAQAKRKIRKGLKLEIKKGGKA